MCFQTDSPVFFRSLDTKGSEANWTWSCRLYPKAHCRCHFPPRHCPVTTVVMVVMRNVGCAEQRQLAKASTARLWNGAAALCGGPTSLQVMVFAEGLSLLRKTNMKPAQLIPSMSCCASACNCAVQLNIATLEPGLPRNAWDGGSSDLPRRPVSGHGLARIVCEKGPYPSLLRSCQVQRSLRICTRSRWALRAVSFTWRLCQRREIVASPDVCTCPGDPFTRKLPTYA
jgi:hypothetical protein